MSFTNLYRPPEPIAKLLSDELYGPDPYDINFAFPIHLPSLESSLVKLTPFIPRIHGKAFWDIASQHVDTLYRFFPFSHVTEESFLSQIELFIRRNPENILFAIIDKSATDATSSGNAGNVDEGVAGIIGIFDCSKTHLSTEISHVTVLPPYQRTHIAKHAVGILLRYCLELPNAPLPGLGFRRVQWKCHWQNPASRKLAERMGIKFEGTTRWLKVLPEAFQGEHTLSVEGRADPLPNNRGLHVDLLAACWDDWESGLKGQVEDLLTERLEPVQHV